MIIQEPHGITNIRNGTNVVGRFDDGGDATRY
jgi:hypothetical protein